MIHEDEKHRIETNGNHIRFYVDDIERHHINDLAHKISSLSYELREYTDHRGLPITTPIYLHISTNGGATQPAFAMADMMLSSHVPIYTISEGLVASAGTLIALAGARRYMLPSSSLLIHEHSMWMADRHSMLKDNMKHSDSFSERILEFYLARTNIKKKKLKKMLKGETWLSSQECISLGVVDEILYPDIWQCPAPIISR